MGNLDNYVFAISGASGAPIALRVLGELVRHMHIHLIISENSYGIIREELGLDWTKGERSEVEGKIRRHLGTEEISLYGQEHMWAPVASGSFRHRGMAVVPCSVKTLSGVANGYGSTLIERAAVVTLKESRPLVLSPRETPLGPIELENMLKLARIGVKIVPPVAGFYHKPATLQDMVDFLAGKILDSIGVEHHLYNRWGDK